MREFYEFIGEVLAERPGDVSESLTPWILAGLGGAILLLMAYAWWVAPPY